MKKDINIKEVNKFEHECKEIYDSVHNVIENNIDVNDFNEIMCGNRYTDKLIENLSDENIFNENCSIVNEAFEKRNNEKLILKINQRKNRNKINRIYITASSIAGAILLFSILMFYGESKQDLISSLNSDVLVPTLITEDKTIIKLNKDNNKITSTEYKSSLVRQKVIDSVIKDVNQRLIIPNGHTYNVILADSSEVILNAGSELEFPTNFNDTIRRVNLKGEAYFNIAKNSKPFVVNVNGLDVKVYGTQFNIKTTGANTIETVLVEGSVGVSFDKADEIKMVPNQMLKFDIESKKGELSVVNVDSYTQWINGNFNYYNYNLKYVLADLEKWYNIKFDNVDSLVDKNVTFFTVKEPSVDKVLDMIEKITKIEFINEGGGRYSIDIL